MCLINKHIFTIFCYFSLNIFLRILLLIAIVIIIIGDLKEGICILERVKKSGKYKYLDLSAVLWLEKI